MKDFIIVRNDNHVYEAFECENEKEAVIRYCNYLVSQTELQTIFNKAIQNLEINEIIKLFFATFQFEVDEDDEIKTIYTIGEKRYG